MAKIAAVCALVLCACLCPLQANDSIEADSIRQTGTQLSIREVEVVAHKADMHQEASRLVTQISREQIQSLPVRTVADILQYLPGIDIRTRGPHGVQADISMRGGTFDQVLVLLNGVPLNDCQTGHYTLNLPVSTELIERVEVLQGASVGMSGAFSGAVNIVTKNAEQKKDVVLKLSAGMNGLAHPEIAASLTDKEVHLNMAAGYSRADGYYAPRPSEKETTALLNSDFQMADIYLQTRWRGLDVQAGAQWKDAGLGMGYGFGSQDQFDATRTAFASAQYVHQWNAWRLESQASYRANYDRYEWHRTQISNRHWNQTATASLTARYTSRAGTTSFGISARNENIRSTHLGDHNRLHTNFFAAQRFYYAGLSASLCVNGSYNTQSGFHLGGGADIGYTFMRNQRVYVNAHRSVRTPTFTDLYYNAGNQLGNRDLKPEEAWHLSAGYKGEWLFGSAGELSYSLNGYYRHGKNIIDWVYVPDDSKRPYHAANQQKVNTAGLELSIAYRLNQWLRCISADYAYTYLDLDIKEAGSRYLDYLSHKLTLHVEHGIYKGFGASWNLRFQKREGQYNDAEGAVQDYRPVWLLDGSLFWENRYLRVSAECTNITNTHYYDYGGILQPGAWAQISIRAQLL